MRMSAQMALVTAVAAVSVLPLGSPTGAAPTPAPSTDPTSTPTPAPTDSPTRWPDIDGPSLGRADGAPAPVAQRTAEAPVSLHGTNMVATDVTADEILAAVDAAATTTDRAGSGAKTPPVKVGIIGYFDKALLAKQISAKQLPRIPADQRVCFLAAGRCPFGTPGARTANLVATTLHTKGRAATVDLHLAEAATLPAMRRAIRWMADHDVKVLVPLALVPWDDSGDGTGPAGRLLAEAVDAGMFVVAGAGDAATEPGYDYYNGPYYRATWRDDDADGWMNFATDDESLGAYCGSLYGLRWSDWSGKATDYDLYISDATRTPNGIVDGTDRRLIGGRDQSRRGVEPIEANDFRWLCNDDPRRGPVYDTNGDNFVSLWVLRTDRSNEPAARDVLEVMVLNGWLEYASGFNSTQETWAVAADPGVIAVGALVSGEPAWFTPYGPTNDGRQRPDIAAEACVPLKRSFRCDGEGGPDDSAFNVFRSTAVAAGRGAAAVATLVTEYAPVTGKDLRFMLELLSDLPFFDDDGRGVMRAGWGRLDLVPAPPDDDGALVSFPMANFRPVRSPKRTDAVLDRTFNSVSPLMFDQDYYDYLGGEPLKATPAVVTVTNARRAGTVRIWGRGQVPSDAVTVHFDKSRGVQSRTIMLRDTYGLWVRATTGGDVKIQPVPTVFFGTAASGYTALEPRVVIRQAADGVVPADTPLADESPVWEALSDGSLVMAITIVSPEADGVLRWRRSEVLEFEKGVTTTLYGSSAVWKSLSASVPVRVDIDVLGMTTNAVGAGWRRYSSEVEVSLSPGVDRVVDLGLLPSGARGVADAMVHIETQATSPGSLSIVDETGQVRRLVDLPRGNGTTAAIVRADRGSITLRSTSRMTVRITGFAHTIRAQKPVDVIAPPGDLGRVVHVSDDGMVVAAMSNSGRIRVWDRAANTVRTIDTDPDADPNPTATLTGISSDGTKIAYEFRYTPARIVVHDLATDERTVYPVPTTVPRTSFTSSANGDLSVFVLDPEKVWRVHEGALERVTLTNWRVRAVDASGTRFLADSPLTLGSKIIGPDGKVVFTLGTTPAFVLSSDGRSVVNTKGQVYTDGTLRWELCPGDQDIDLQGIDVDHTADAIVLPTGCPSFAPRRLHVVTPDGRRSLASNLGIGATLSGDGKTAVLVNNLKVLGILSLDG